MPAAASFDYATAPPRCFPAEKGHAATYGNLAGLWQGACQVWHQAATNNMLKHSIRTCMAHVKGGLIEEEGSDLPQSHFYREETYLKFYLDQCFMLITFVKPEMRNNILPGWGGMKHACCSLL